MFTVHPSAEIATSLKKKMQISLKALRKNYFSCSFFLLANPKKIVWRPYKVSLLQSYHRIDVTVLSLWSGRTALGTFMHMLMSWRMNLNIMSVQQNCLVTYLKWHSHRLSRSHIRLHSSNEFSQVFVQLWCICKAFLFMFSFMQLSIFLKTIEISLCL